MAIYNKKIRDICAVLDTLYHSPRLGNKRNPLNEIVFILLTTKTGAKNFNATYTALKQRFETWNEVIDADVNEVADTIRSGGLAMQKAILLQKILRQIKTTSGSRISLSFLNKLSNAEAEAYLLSLPGIGYKTAKCVLLYSLNREVLPVDTHTYKLAYELGLVDQTYMRNEKGKLHKELEPLIPPDCRFSFHVNAVVHGRREHGNRKVTKCQLVQLLEERQLLPLIERA